MHGARDLPASVQQDAEHQIIHAGLECGLFKKPYPEMDMVSIGPITGPHSPDEQVHIERRSVLDAADRAAESHSG